MCKIFDKILIYALKRHIDKNKQPGQFLLTGSQQWGVLNSITESLAELANVKNNQPWLERWLDDPEAFLKKPTTRLSLPYSLYEILWRRSLPEANFIPADLIPDYQASYQRTYIERDIRLLTDVAYLSLFGRFVRLAAALTSQEVNYSELGRNIGITPQTAKRWLTTLTHIRKRWQILPYRNKSFKQSKLI